MSNDSGRELTFGEAIKEALAEELRRDPRVFMIGEDIAEAGTTFKVLNGLVRSSRGRWRARRALSANAG
jgi:pyruvate dehydrogenase E1 component beta subunit